MSDKKYTAEHEWITANGSELTIGITAYAADKLGEIVFAELPSVGAAVEPGKVIAEVESTKSVGEVFAPVAGTVTEVNDAVVDNPELISDSAETDGWLFKLEVSDTSVLDADEFLTLDAYKTLIGE